MAPNHTEKKLPAVKRTAKNKKADRSEMPVEPEQPMESAELLPSYEPNKKATRKPAEKIAGRRGKIRRFTLFNKLPKELQCYIWRLAMEPRIVRAKFESNTNGPGISYQTFYHLACGPVPGILHVNGEARYEGLKHYTAIRSRAPPHKGMDKSGSKPAKQATIYINFNIDTLYFVNWSTISSFLCWMRRIPRENRDLATLSPTALAVAKKYQGTEMSNKPLKAVKHVAFTGRDISRCVNSAAVFDFWYGMVVDNPNLKTITMVNDESKFGVSLKPEAYSFKALVPYSPAELPEMVPGHLNFYLKNRAHSPKLLLPLLGNIFEKPVGAELADKFRAWRLTESGKLWIKPDIEIAKISMSKEVGASKVLVEAESEEVKLEEAEST